MNNKENQKRLVILGNGFEIEHGFCSKWDQIFEDTQKLFSINSKTSVLGKIGESELWSDFEKALGDMVLSYYSFFFKTHKYFNFLDEKTVNENYKEIEYFIDQVIEKNKNIKYSEEDINRWILKIDKEINGEELFYDKTIKIKIIMVRKIIELLQDFNFKKKHSNIFNRENDYVLNYNYTSFSYGSEGYFDQEKSLNIHGKICKNWQPGSFKYEENYISQDKRLYLFELGLYHMSEGISSDDSKYNGKDKKLINDIANYMETSKLYFWKLADISGEKWKKIEEFFSKTKGVKKILIFGHSLSGNDIPNIIKYINVKNIESIVYIGKIKDKEVTKKNIKSIFSFEGDIEIKDISELNKNIC